MDCLITWLDAHSGTASFLATLLSCFLVVCLHVWNVYGQRSEALVNKLTEIFEDWRYKERTVGTNSEDRRLLAIMEAENCLISRNAYLRASRIAHWGTLVTKIPPLATINKKVKELRKTIKAKDKYIKP